MPIDIEDRITEYVNDNIAVPTVGLTHAMCEIVREILAEHSAILWTAAAEFWMKQQEARLRSPKLQPTLTDEKWEEYERVISRIAPAECERCTCPVCARSYRELRDMIDDEIRLQKADISDDIAGMVGEWLNTSTTRETMIAELGQYGVDLLGGVEE